MAWGSCAAIGVAASNTSKSRRIISSTDSTDIEASVHQLSRKATPLESLASMVLPFTCYLTMAGDE